MKVATQGHPPDRETGRSTVFRSKGGSGDSCIRPSSRVSEAGTHLEQLHMSTSWALPGQVPACCNCPGEQALSEGLATPGGSDVTFRNARFAYRQTSALGKISTLSTQSWLIQLQNLWSDLPVQAGSFSGGPDGFIYSL